jgi:protein-S-isoprenylcysteine O-methyltransferase Ste14
VLGQPVNLVVRGPYRHVRNPMISGVVAILLGEAAVFASGWLLLWAIVFFTALTTFIQRWEEPHLAQRFGEEYVTYRRNVPRWIPRLSAWRPTPASVR